MLVFINDSRLLCSPRRTDLIRNLNFGHRVLLPLCDANRTNICSHERQYRKIRVDYLLACAANYRITRRKTMVAASSNSCRRKAIASTIATLKLSSGLFVRHWQIHLSRLELNNPSITFYCKRRSSKPQALTGGSAEVDSFCLLAMNNLYRG